MPYSKTGFFTKHSKSSAALVSLVIHAVMVVAALFFVAVSVIQKQDVDFEAKAVSRPRMNLRKLQVPVNIRKPVHQPRLRKQIVVRPDIAKITPEIKMPEIVGVKGGLGSGAVTGFGGGSLGFTMPEFNLFGVRGRGEKIFIIIDVSGSMLVDSRGGIPAFTIIKDEVIGILDNLNSTVLVNVAIYGGDSYTCFSAMVPASTSNVNKVKRWLEPLNAVSRDMGGRDYGPKTAGPGGIMIKGDFTIDPVKSNTVDWSRPMFEAMKQQADTVYLITASWGHIATTIAAAAEWSDSKWERWNDKVEEAKEKLEEENELRRKKGMAPRVITEGNYGLVRAYFPGEPEPPKNKNYYYSPKEMAQAFSNTREKWSAEMMKKRSELRRKGPSKEYTINVVYFVGADKKGTVNEKFDSLTDLTGGEYRTIAGLQALESLIASTGE